MQITIEGKQTDLDKALIIGQADDQLIATLSNGLDFGSAMKMLGTLSLHVLNAYAQANPKAKEELYQAYNYQASNVLAAFIPDAELRPDITAEAIMQLEDEMIAKKYDKLNREARRKGKQAFNRAKRKLAREKEKPIQ